MNINRIIISVMLRCPSPFYVNDKMTAREKIFKILKGYVHIKKN